MDEAGDTNTGHERVKLVTVEPDSTLLKRVVALADLNSEFLGFFPANAFSRSAAQRRIIAAVDAPSDNLAGYVLYFVALGRAVIQHLCVSKEFLNRGVGRSLVDELSLRTTACDGISLHCRRDFPSHAVWSKLGFVPVGEKRGRGDKPTTLTRFWKDFGKATLFTEAIEKRLSSRTIAVMDANVVFDFCDLNRANSETTRILNSGWIRESIELCVTEEIFNEINRDTDTVRRQRSRDTVRGFPSVEPDSTRFKAIQESLARILGSSNSERDRSDALHLCIAIAADAAFFVTREQRLLDRADDIDGECGITVIRPIELIVRHDELRRQTEYQPARLSGTLINIGRMKDDDIGIVIERFKARGDETKGEWASMVRNCLSDSEKFDCLIVGSAGQPPAAAVIIEFCPDCAQVRAFRIVRSKLSPTLARSLTSQIVQKSVERGLPVTRVTDTRCEFDVTNALFEFGFIRAGDSWNKVNLIGVATAAVHAASIERISTAQPTAQAQCDDLLALLDSGDNDSKRSRLAAFERQAWPARVDDASLPTFAVPIQARWAKELFDEGLARTLLFGADPMLALNSEHVYYRAAKPSVLSAPARIIWYVSKDGAFDGTGAFRAISSLDEVVVGRAKDLSRRFQRLGVFTWKDVLSTAKGDAEAPIMAVVFSGTQLFPRPLLFGIFAAELSAIGRAVPPLSTPYEIPPALFATLCRKGLCSADEPIDA